MLGAFPYLYPGEPVYSGVARYSDRMGYSSSRAIIDEVFGHRSAVAVLDLPSYLGILANALPCGAYTAADLVWQHTMLPLYVPFLPAERVKQLEQAMIRAGGSGIHMRAGVMASSVAASPARLQYCPECLGEDRQRYGEGYWRLVQQAAGVLVCPYHQQPLYASAVCLNTRRTRYEFVSLESALSKKHRNYGPQPSGVYRSDLVTGGAPGWAEAPHLNAIAASAAWIMEHRPLVLGLEALRARYLGLLAQRGYATLTGAVHARKLVADFKGYFGDPMLAEVGCALEESVGDSWLLRLVRKPDNAHHPLRHILLMRFLETTVEQFFAAPRPRLYFGSPPWPCLNPAAAHYRQGIIGSCSTSWSADSRRPVGTFACECGFVYSRVGPDRSYDDRYRYSRVEQYGPTWEGALQRMWGGPGVGLRQAARMLGVDPKTVKRHACRIGAHRGLAANAVTLVEPSAVGAQNSTQEESPNKARDSEGDLAPDESRVRYRQLWLSAMAANPDAGTTTLRRRALAAYSWLYRHDRGWLTEHRPNPVRQGNRGARHNRVDWGTRDGWLCEEVRAAAGRLRRRAGRPVAITATAIARESGYGALLESHLDKLPKTRAALQALVETRGAYAARRVEWAVSTWQAEQGPPSRWQIVKRAGVERVLGDPSVEAALRNALRSPHGSYRAGALGRTSEGVEGCEQ